MPNLTHKGPSPLARLHRRLAGLVALACLATLAACSDAQLYQSQGTAFQNDRLTVSGRFCTIDPAQELFPVKVLLLVDTSTTMAALDPTYSVAQAVSDVFDRYLHSTQGNYSFGVIGYGGRARLLSGGASNESFTRQPNLLQNALQLLRLPEPCQQKTCRDLQGALSLAASLVTGDALNTPTGRIARTRYVIINLLGDPPSPRVMRCQCTPTADPMCSIPDATCEASLYTGRLQQLINQIRDAGAKELRFHTLYLRDVQNPPPPDKPVPATQHDEAINLLQRLSATGGGLFECHSAADLPDCSKLFAAGSADYNACVRQNMLCPASAVSFLGYGLEQAQKPFLIKKLLAYNLNTVGTQTGPKLDSDGDGLPDEDELLLGTAIDNADSDGDGLSDFIETRLGLDPLRRDDPPPACADVDFTQLGRYPLLDQDGDFLNDCEERLLGTDPTLADSDGDGLPDGLELRGGTNALAADYLLPLYDHDGVPNGDEIRQHTAARADDTMEARGFAYHYEEQSEGVKSLPYSSQPRNITGVTVLDVSPGSTPGAGSLRFHLGPPACDQIYPAPRSSADDAAYRRCQACPTCPSIQWKDAGDCDFGPPALIDPPQILKSGGVALTLLSKGATGGCDATSGTKADYQIVVRIENPQVLPRTDTQETIVVGTALRACERYQISNIALQTPVKNRTLGSEEQQVGMNNVYVLFGQGPDGLLLAPGVFSTALVRVRYAPPARRDPPDPNLVLRQEDFVVVGDN